MERVYLEDQIFEKKQIADLTNGSVTYDNCIFRDCNLSGADLSLINFMDVKFLHCDISNATVQKAALRNITFKDCKIMGLLFDDCEDFLFEVGFENCILNFSSFTRRKMKKTSFINCIINEADFAYADLTGANFDRCDLSGTKFENTILEKADFRTSVNYTIDPELNKLKKAKFSLAGLPGLLDKYGIVIEN